MTGFSRVAAGAATSSSSAYFCAAPRNLLGRISQSVPTPLEHCTRTAGKRWAVPESLKFTRKSGTGRTPIWGSPVTRLTVSVDAGFDRPRTSDAQVHRLARIGREEPGGTENSSFPNARFAGAKSRASAVLCC
jgi:hypothetical protein